MDRFTPPGRSSSPPLGTSPSTRCAVNTWCVLSPFRGADAVDVVETVSKQQELELLTKAIQSLPERCRQILTLRTAYGLSQKQIADQLGVSLSTIEKQMAQGIHLCAEYFARPLRP